MQTAQSDAKTVSAVEELSHIFLNGLLYKNPVLVNALGLCSVLVAGTTLKNGVAFSLMLPVLLLPQCILFCLFGEKVPGWVRPAVCLVLSALLYIPASLLVKAWMPGVLENLGIFAPLIIVNAIVFVRADGFAVKHVLLASVVDAAGHAAGFAVAVCLISAVRELLVFGTLWGDSPVWLGEARVGGLGHAFVGFIVLGFCAAFVQWLGNRRKDKERKRKEMER